MAHITTDQLRDILARQSSIPVIDVLSEESFRDVHIPGSESVPLDDARFAERVAGLVGGDKEAPVVVYCRNEECTASTRAVRKLEAAGFTEVYEYDGGLEAWEAAGNELVRT